MLFIFLSAVRGWLRSKTEIWADYACGGLSQKYHHFPH